MYFPNKFYNTNCSIGGVSEIEVVEKYNKGIFLVDMYAYFSAESKTGILFLEGFPRLFQKEELKNLEFKMFSAGTVCTIHKSNFSEGNHSMENETTCIIEVEGTYFCLSTLINMHNILGSLTEKHTQLKYSGSYVQGKEQVLKIARSYFIKVIPPAVNLEAFFVPVKKEKANYLFLKKIMNYFIL